MNSMNKKKNKYSVFAAVFMSANIVFNLCLGFLPDRNVSLMGIVQWLLIVFCIVTLFLKTNEILQPIAFGIKFVLSSIISIVSAESLRYLIGTSYARSMLNYVIYTLPYGIAAVFLAFCKVPAL
ncbi:MAG: hypothetical protein IJL26_11300, partial [Clostridia bacterium]|nr:hypothetical protein [Clostridia bacterium]